MILDSSTSSTRNKGRRKGKAQPFFKLGDLFTTMTILVSVASLLVAWGQERRVQEKAQADAVRHAASTALAKLERHEELSVFYYDQAQPLFINASQKLQDDFDPWSVRDRLWNQLDVAHTSSLDAIHRENLEQAYVELYGSSPRMYQVISKSVVEMRHEERLNYALFQSEVQDDVISQLPHRKDYTSAMLGNQLRDTANKYQEQLRGRLDAVLTQPRRDINRIILSSDADILHNTALDGTK